MNYLKQLFYIFFFLIQFINLFGYEKPKFITYIHPSPNYKYSSAQTTIVIKVDKSITEISKSLLKFEVMGEKSGLHNGNVIISDNTVIYKTAKPFKASEKVFVSLTTDILEWEIPYKYQFTISSLNELVEESFNSTLNKNNHQAVIHNNSKTENLGEIKVINGVSVPSDFPHLQPEIIGENIAEGKIFLATFIGSPYILILENDGTPYFYQRLEKHSKDFKIQPNGLLTRYLEGDRNAYLGMDSNYTVIDTFHATPSYSLDDHEITILENGHYFLIAYHHRYIDMSQFVEGGDTNASIRDNFIQEFDENKNLVFEWSATEHFDILDAIHQNLKASSIDWVHMNSIAIDYDDHIILSSRNLSEVTKINRETGDIIWRLGGVNNEFNFLNDESQISYQHDVRPVPNKPNHYTIFDNGNFHSPQISRAVEFYLDTLNMTATKVWEYGRNNNYFTWWMGNVQRLNNGNTLINFVDKNLPKAVEVTPDGEVIYKADYESENFSYRTFRFEWESIAKSPYLIVESQPDKVSLIFNKFGDKSVENYIVYAGQNPNDLTPIDTTQNTYLYLTNLTNQTKYYFQVTTLDSSGKESDFSNLEEILVNYSIPGSELIENGDFSDGSFNWELTLDNNASANGLVNDLGEYEINISNSGDDIDDIRLVQENIPLLQENKYVLEFDAYSDVSRIIDIKIENSDPPYENYSQTGPIIIGNLNGHFKIEFKMQSLSDYSCRLVLSCGTNNSNLYFDSFSLSDSTLTDMNRIKIIRDSYALFNNYPNPFNPTTTISYFVPEPCSIKISIYNLLGEVVQISENNFINYGLHNYEFDASKLSSGVYFYSLEANSINSSNTFIDFKKMSILK